MSAGGVSKPAGSPTHLGLWVEWVVVWIGVPIALTVFRDSFSRFIVPVLLVVGTVCGVLLWRDPTFDRRRLGFGTDGAGLGAGLARLLRHFVPVAIAVAFVTWWLVPERWLAFPRTEPEFWVVVMVLYPLLSVYPQELIFRTFFFHRYRRLFVTDDRLCLANAFVFGLAHLFFANWLAPVMTALGGWLFARTYARSGSTVLASVEHGLWGDFVFTIGLGTYFWGGSIRLALDAIG